MGVHHVATVRGPLQPTHPAGRNPGLGRTTQQSDDAVEPGDVAPKHRAEQVENEIRLKIDYKFFRTRAKYLCIYQFLYCVSPIPFKRSIHLHLLSIYIYTCIYT